MAQQGVIRTVAQRETDLAHPARRGWPHGGLAVQLGQPFVVGESGNAKVPLRHALDAEQPLFACGAQQRQAGAGVDIQQLVDQRGDKRRFTAPAQAGYRQT